MLCFCITTNYINKQIRNLIDNNIDRKHKDRLTPRAYRELIQVQEHIRKAINEIIDKQEELINMQQSLIKTMQQGLQGVELNELLLKKQLADLQEELVSITNDYIDSKNIYKGGA